MRGLILAGGFATRLRPLSCSKPKLLFPIVGTPLVESMARWLSSGGVDQIILAVNHLSDKLKIEVGHHVAGVTVKFSVEQTPLGTAGPIRLAANLLGKDDPLFVTNGDIVSDIEIRGMLAMHEETNAEARAKGRKTRCKRRQEGDFAAFTFGHTDSHGSGREGGTSRDSQRQRECWR